jgi:hypothetical protein
MTVHVQCNNCGAWAMTDNHRDPDGAVRCTSAEGDPPGSVEGSCCTAGRTHEEHAEFVRSGDEYGAQCRPVTITIMPGPSGVQLAGVSDGQPQPPFGSPN